MLILFVRVLEIGRKANLWSVSERVQINSIFTDNVRLLRLSCNAKKSPKTNTKLSQKSRNNRRFNRFQWCPF
jgi:hypothetical protein